MLLLADALSAVGLTAGWLPAAGLLPVLLLPGLRRRLLLPVLLLLPLPASGLFVLLLLPARLSHRPLPMLLLPVLQLLRLLLRPLPLLLLPQLLLVRRRCCRRCLGAVMLL